jgi:WD40 repeat protein
VVPDNGLVEVACTQWSDGLFDVAWSETDANIVVSASGDGGLQLWNMSCPQVIDGHSVIRLENKSKSNVVALFLLKKHPNMR